MPALHYRYKAFISYRHLEQDRYWAKWLMERLETFRTPRSLVTENYPARLGKLFRDDDEIPAAGRLRPQIEEALRSSEFLIVICSRNTPASKWVENEIAFFQSLGRGECIIPVLIDGSPQESFPANLHHDPAEQKAADVAGATAGTVDLLAVDVRPRPGEKPRAVRRRAIVRIAATLLHCGYDLLADRERARQRRRQRIAQGIAATVGAMMLAAGLYWWDYTRLKTRFFVEATSRYARPMGVSPVSAREARQMNVSYRFESRRNQVLRVIRQTGATRASAVPEGYHVDPWLVGVAQWHYEYDVEGRVATVRLADEMGETLFSESYRSYSPTLDRVTVRFELQDPEGNLRAGEVPSTGHLLGGSDGRSEVTQHSVVFDGQGRITARYFESAYGIPTSDAAGSAGRTYTHDAAGNVAAISFVDVQRRPVSLKSGIARIAIIADDAARPRRLSLHNPDGGRIVGSEGFSSQSWSRDAIGNVTAITYEGASGRRILQQNGYRRSHHQYDRRGNLVEDRYTGTHGDPVLNLDGYHRRVTQYQDGHAVRESYFDTAGAPVASASRGYASVTWRRDNVGRVIEEAYFDSEDKPTTSVAGIARFERTWTGGRVTEGAYFDVDGKLALTLSGYAKYRQEFDERGHLKEFLALGTDGQPVLIDGYAGFRQSTDVRGNVTERTFFGLDKETVNHLQDGYATVRADYDANGRLTIEAYFDDQERLVTGPNGFAKVVVTYNEFGLPETQAYFGPDDRPAPYLDGCASDHRTYDSRGLLRDQRYFGADREICVTGGNYARRGLEYDDMARVRRISYFDSGDRPVATRERYAAVELAYDPRGNVEEMAYLDPQGRPTLGTQGFARLVSKYDGRSRLLRRQYLGVGGEPVEVAEGYATVILSYELNDDIASYTFEDARGTRIAIDVPST